MKPSKQAFKHRIYRLVTHIWVTLGLFAVVVATFIAYVVAEKQIDRANELRQDSFLVAEELRQSSDDLTRMVRTYIATGDPIYKRHYHEILAIRDGRAPRPLDYQSVYWDLILADDVRPRPSGEAVPLLTLIQRAGFTEQELARLNEAKLNSDSLTRTELAAMALIETAAPVSAVRSEALAMLHDDAYHRAKADIMRPIADFYSLMNRRTAALVHETETRALRMRLTLVMISSLLIVQIVGVWRRQRIMLGGKLEDVYRGLVAIGSGRWTAADELANGSADSILGWVAEARSKLARLDAARRHADDVRQLYANVFQRSGEAIMITDTENRIVAVNSAFTRLTGYTIEDVAGQNPRLLASQRTPRETYQAMWAALTESGFWQGELWDRCKDGHLYPKWVAISVLRDQDGKVTNFIASFTDITERKAAEERISRLAHHDPLTGLFNRFSLQERLEQTLLAAQREKRQLTVLFVDMDRFKLINDTLGHHAGDALLVEVAKRLQGCVRESDIVARLGGDEFVVVLTGVESGFAAGASIADKILHQLAQPYAFGERELHSSPSIGISIFPTDGENVEVLMKNADTAMYHAKEQGRNNFQFFTASMTETANERLQMEHELRQALAHGQFELHYQPQVRGIDNRIHGVEALVRWRHPQQGTIPPGKFIPIAEEIGLIEELGRWVLDEACRQLSVWKSLGIDRLRMGVNLSARQLRSPTLVEEIRTVISRHSVREAELELEITESVAMENPQRAIGQLQALRQLGVELAIDDFGTGYSSLAYLKLLPIQTLKLDRAFVRDLETDDNDAAISVATLALARNLGLTVVAEGVETEGQRAFLVDHACDVLQGYFFSKPLPADAATEYLIRNLG